MVLYSGVTTDNMKVFKLQKRIIRLMTGSKVPTSCRPLFPKLGIISLSCQYVFSLMRLLFQNLFNSAIHDYNTRNGIRLHKPSSVLTKYQKGLYCKSIEIFDKLLYNIAELILQKKVCKNEKSM
jgi:hypothetical protein